MSSPLGLRCLSPAGNKLGSNLVLTDVLASELSRLLPKFVSIEMTEPEALIGNGQKLFVTQLL